MSADSDFVEVMSLFFGDIVFEDTFEEANVRRSWKYVVNCRDTNLPLNYVFAANSDEAEQRARERYEIPDTDEVVVIRVPDNDSLTMRLN